MQTSHYSAISPVVGHTRRVGVGVDAHVGAGVDVHVGGSAGCGDGVGVGGGDSISEVTPPALDQYILGHSDHVEILHAAHLAAAATSQTAKGWRLVRHGRKVKTKLSVTGPCAKHVNSGAAVGR